MPFTIIGKTKQAKLHDLAIRLPSLIERTDSIIVSKGPDFCVTGKIIELKMDYVSLREDFIDWFKYAAVDSHGPIYWYTSELPDIKSEDDPICVPNLLGSKNKITFKDGTRAGLLAHYWAFQLELIMGLQDLYVIELDDHVQLLDLVPGLDVDSCLSEADNLAQLILEALPYLSSCLEGRITSQGPLEVLARYRKRMNLI